MSRTHYRRPGRRAVAALFLFAAAAVATAIPAQQSPPRVQFSNAVHPCNYETEQGGKYWLTVRVLDGILGTPIPGAELWLVPEQRTPMRGEFHGTLAAAADADGFLRLELPLSVSWLLVRAPGYGPILSHKYLGGGDEIFPMAPGRTVSLRILDHVGRPAGPGALVGFCRGCGHTPDLAHGRTDQDGVVHLPGLDLRGGIADFYVEYPDLGLGYAEVGWFPGMPPVPFVVAPGRSRHGTVLDADGRPLAGVAVGAFDLHRGPWTRTGPDGRFALHGTEGDRTLQIETPEGNWVFDDLGPDPLTLRLTPRAGVAPHESIFVAPVRAPVPDDAQVVRVRLVDENDKPVEPFAVVCRGPLPAMEEKPLAQGGGLWLGQLPPGRYEVTADSWDHRAVTVPFVVGVDPVPTVVVRLVRRPSVRVVVPTLPDDVNVYQRTATRSRRLDVPREEGLHGNELGVSVLDEPCWIVLSKGYGALRAFPVDPNATEPLRPSWFPPTRVLGRVVDAAGKPLSAQVVLERVGRSLAGSVAADWQPAAAEDDDPEDDDPEDREPGPEEWDGERWSGAASDPASGRFVVEIAATGLGMLHIRVPGQPGSRLVPVVLPPLADDAVVEVGDVVVGGPPAVRVVDGNGQPMVGAVALLRPGWVDVTGWADVIRGLPCFPLGADGALAAPDAQAGDVMVLPGRRQSGEDEPAVFDVSVSWPLAGAGPWTLTVPPGELDLQVRGADGEPMEARVFVGRDSFEVEGSCLLRRLPIGPLRLFVAAKGHRTAVVDLDVVAGRQSLPLVLPAW